MNVIKKVPYVVVPLPTQIEPPQDSITLLVKGSFRLVPNGTLEALPEAEQEPISGDRRHLDELGRSLAYASDLEPYKVNGDLLLSGACHQPDGTAGPSCRVALACGEWRKELMVFGDRLWMAAEDGSAVASEPEPFVSLPLRWELAFGGLESPDNPMGKGLDELEDGDGQPYWPLPNIEDPAQPIEKLEDNPMPVGFGAIPPDWVVRALKYGTRDRRWATLRAPLPPKDFDHGFHNAAPEDQQFDGGFRGDETLSFENLHPEHPQLTATLPGRRPRALAVVRGEAGQELVELPLTLDTIQVAMAEERVTLVWRGALAAGSPLDVIANVFCVAEEPLAGTPATTDELWALFREEVEALAPEAEEQALQQQVEAAMAELQAQIAGADLDPAVKESLADSDDPRLVFETLLGEVEKRLERLKKQAE